MRVRNWMHGIIAAAVLAASPALFAAEDPTPHHVKWMKESGELQGKIRKGIEVEASAKRTAAIYKEVEGFWAKRSEDGAKSARDAQAAANELAKVAASVTLPPSPPPQRSLAAHAAPATTPTARRSATPSTKSVRTIQGGVANKLPAAPHSSPRIRSS